MQLTPLPSAGIELPQIIFGTSAFGNLYQETTRETKLEVVRQMLEHIPGLIALDSAGKYGAGLALESLGETLSELNVPRERVLISNKLGWRRTELKTEEPTFEPGVWVGLQHDAVQDISGDGILRCWKEGNQFLGGYDAQLLSVHDPDEYLSASSDPADRDSRWEDITGAYRALGELRRDGKAKAIGVGSKDWRVSQRIADVCELDWVMLATSLTIFRHEPELLDFIASLTERGIAVINSAVFHGGFLVGGEFFDYRLVSRESKQDADLFLWRDQFYSLCKQYGVTPAEACVAFGISPPGVVAIALNTSRPDKVEANAGILDKPIDDGFWKAMKQHKLIRADYPHLGDS